MQQISQQYMVNDYNMNFDGELEDTESIILDDSKKSNDVHNENTGNNTNTSNDNNISNSLVDKDMLIGDIVDEHPELVPIIMDYGVHCVGCGAAMFETLEEGLMGHGMDEEEVEQVITELNDYIKNNSKEADTKQPSPL